MRVARPGRHRRRWWRNDLTVAELQAAQPVVLPPDWQARTRFVDVLQAGARTRAQDREARER